MSLLKPEITVTLFPRKSKKTDTTTPQEPTPDYVAASKEAAEDLGKKFFIAAGAVSIATVAAATVGGLVLITVNHALNK